MLWTYPGVGAGDPVVGPDGTIYTPATHAITPSGQLKWKRDIGESGPGSKALGPAVGGDGTVYVGDDRFSLDSGMQTTELHALDPATGTTTWSHPIERWTNSSPTIGADGTVYVGTAPGGGQGALYAIKPDGTLRWRWDSGSSCWIESSAAIGGSGDIYVNHNCLGLVALSAAGQQRWNLGSVGQAFNSPSIGSDGTVYLGSSPGFNAVAPDGTLKWTAATEGWMYDASSAISADGATIYRGDNDGNFYAFDSSGCVRWRYDTDTDAGIFSAPALAANGIVYFTGRYLYAMRAADGQLLWRYDIGPLSGSPAIGADGTLYVIGGDESGENYVLYAFRGGGAPAGGILAQCPADDQPPRDEPPTGEPPPGADSVAPVLRRLRISPTTFRAARSGPSVSAKVGGRVSYRLSEPGTTRFRVHRAAVGRRVGGTCVRTTRRNRRKSRCRRWVRHRGSFNHESRDGINRFRFRGRIGGRRLRPGRYRLEGVCRDGDGNRSAAKRVRFRIVP